MFIPDASGSACARPSLIMTPDDTQHGPDRGRVLPFQRRGQRPVAVPPPPQTPVEDVGKYAHRGADDDYGHRMKANVAALVVVVVLIVCGIWIADTIAQMRKNQDCVLSGRRGCTPVQVQPTPRY
jgi:hypothetical protein